MSAEPMTSTGVRIATEAERIEIRRKLDAEAQSIVLAHRKAMIAVVNNKGIKDTYNTYQALLPQHLKMRAPVIIPGNYLAMHDWRWRKEAKHLYSVNEKVQNLIKDDEELKQAYEQYKLLARLAS